MSANANNNVLIDSVQQAEANVNGLIEDIGNRGGEVDVATMLRMQKELQDFANKVEGASSVHSAMSQAMKTVAQKAGR